MLILQVYGKKRTISKKINKLSRIFYLTQLISRIIFYICDININRLEIKKLNSLILIILLTLSFYNCSSDNNTSEPEPEIPDNVRPPYNIRYEVRFSSNAVSDTPEISHAYEYGGIWRIASAPGTTHYVTNSELINGWTKEFTVTVDTNPLIIE